MKIRRRLTLMMLTIVVFLAPFCTKNDVPNVTIDTANNKSVGNSAKELLTADKPSLVIEIDYMTGFQLQSSTISALNDYVHTYTNKGTIQVIENAIPVTGADTLSLAQIDQIERKNRTTFNSSNQVSVYILVTDAGYNVSNTLGFAYRNTSITLFGKTLHNYSGGVNQVARWKLETTTLEHEFGHLFGLVNLGSAMQVDHADPSSVHHCNNKNCLMYYEIETTKHTGTLMNNDIPLLDDNCHNDLTANGGK